MSVCSRVARNGGWLAPVTHRLIQLRKGVVAASKLSDVHITTHPCHIYFKVLALQGIGSVEERIWHCESCSGRPASRPGLHGVVITS